MNVQEIKLLFAYNSWANNRLFEAAAALSEDQYKRDLQSSHGGIHGTLAHIVGAEKIWLSRWIRKPESTVMTGKDIASLEELKKVWEEVGRRTATFLAGMNDNKLQSTIEIVTTEGKRYTHSYQQMFQHLVNHSSYHRGQITTMLRQLGAKPVGTDMIAFHRLTTK